MNQTEASLRRLRFSLRFIFALVTAVAVCFFVAKNSDWIAGVGLFVAFLLAIVALRLPNWPFPQIQRYCCLSMACAIAWFAAVDRFTAMERCSFCDIHHFTDEYRLLGISISKSKLGEHGDLFTRIASDFGRPCLHDYHRVPLTRHWGLMYCARPCIGITCCLGGGDGYDERLRERVLRLVERDPRVADEFDQWLRTGWDKDYDYLKTFYQRLDNEEPQE